MIPLARKPFPPPPSPGVPIPARPPPPGAVDSQTVRKHSTSLASPHATAAIASITDPSWPGCSGPPAYHDSFKRKASCSSGMPGPEKPRGPNQPPGYVVTPSMSRRSRPASAIAARHALSVRFIASRPSRRPTCDCPIPLITARRSTTSVTPAPNPARLRQARELVCRPRFARARRAESRRRRVPRR